MPRRARPSYACCAGSGQHKPHPPLLAGFITHGIISMSEYTIIIDDEVVCKTDWLPRAQAAWSRAIRDRDASHGKGFAIFIRDGKEISRTRVQTGRDEFWPEPGVGSFDNHDVANAITSLARRHGVSSVMIAEVMSEQGLTTSHSRIKSISRSSGYKSYCSCAEIIVMLHAVTSAISQRLDAGTEEIDD